MEKNQKEIKLNYKFKSIYFDLQNILDNCPKNKKIQIYFLQLSSIKFVPSFIN